MEYVIFIFRDKGENVIWLFKGFYMYVVEFFLGDIIYIYLYILDRRLNIDIIKVWYRGLVSLIGVIYMNVGVNMDRKRKIRNVCY